MRTTQHKGDVAVSQAVASFTRLGYDVSLPFTESVAYDLIVDTDKGLKRVRVRYTSSGEVDLRRVHSNAKGYVVKKTKPHSYDWLYIFKGTGEEYLLKDCLVQRSFTPTNNHKLVKTLKTSKNFSS